MENEIMELRKALLNPKLALEPPGVWEYFPTSRVKVVRTRIIQLPVSCKTLDISARRNE